MCELLLLAIPAEENLGNIYIEKQILSLETQSQSEELGLKLTVPKMSHPEIPPDLEKNRAFSANLKTDRIAQLCVLGTCFHALNPPYCLGQE